MKITFVRHGESTANIDQIYSGWLDVRLTKKGINQAREIGQLIKDDNYDIVYTSCLSRAIQTSYYILDSCDKLHINVEKTWKLNGRHMGFLQGCSKIDILEKFGKDKADYWRLNYTAKVPEIDPTSPFKGKGPDWITSESLEDNYQRTIQYYHDNIENVLRSKNVLVVAHLHTIRCFIKYIENISDKDIEKLIIPHGEIISYQSASDGFVNKNIINI